MAAAIGSGLPVTEPLGSMVIDIGGGTTEMAVFSLEGIVVSRSIRVAGDEMDDAIVQYARQKYNLLIGQRMAERAKITIGSAYPLPEEQTITLRGRNLVTGLPEAVEVSSVEIREALRDAVSIIVDTVRSSLTLWKTALPWLAAVLCYKAWPKDLLKKAACESMWPMIR